MEAKMLMLGRAFGPSGCIRIEFRTGERSCAALERLPVRFKGVLGKHEIVQRSEARKTAYYGVTDGE